MADTQLLRYMTPVQRANAAKAARLAHLHGLFDRALSRVERSPRLRKYKHIIMVDYGGRHWQWVAYAKVGEIESWAQQIKEDSDG